MILPRGSIITLSGASATGLAMNLTLSEHGRKEFQISNERIENSKRMVDGTLRKNFIVSKETVSTSWDNLPSRDDKTVDNGAGGASLKNFYDKVRGRITLTYAYDESGTGTGGTMYVMIKNFSYTVVKRATSSPNFDLVSASIEFEEV